MSAAVIILAIISVNAVAIIYWLLRCSIEIEDEAMKLRRALADLVHAEDDRRFLTSSSQQRAIGDALERARPLLEQDGEA